MKAEDACSALLRYGCSHSDLIYPKDAVSTTASIGRAFLLYVALREFILYALWLMDRSKKGCGQNGESRG